MAIIRRGALTPTPFRIDVPQAVLDHIGHRLACSRIGYMPDDPDQWKYGMDARYLAELVDYWRSTYDWRALQPCGGH